MIGKPTFIWTPSNSSSGGTKPAVFEAVMGGGYRVRTRDGLKSLMRNVPLDFSPIEMPEAQAIHDFLDMMAGMPFWWLPIKPLPQVECRWTCDDYKFKRDPGGLIVGLTATFMKFNSPSVP